MSERLLAATLAQHRCQLDGRLHLKKGPRTVQSVFRLTGTEQALPFDG